MSENKAAKIIPYFTPIIPKSQNLIIEFTNFLVGLNRNNLV